MLLLEITIIAGAAYFGAGFGLLGSLSIGLCGFVALRLPTMVISGLTRTIIIAIKGETWWLMSIGPRVGGFMMALTVLGSATSIVIAYNFVPALTLAIGAACCLNLFSLHLSNRLIDGTSRQRLA